MWPGIFIGAFLVNVATAGSPATSLGICQWATHLKGSWAPTWLTGLPTVVMHLIGPPMCSSSRRTGWSGQYDGKCHDRRDQSRGGWVRRLGRLRLNLEDLVARGHGGCHDRGPVLILWSTPSGCLGAGNG